VNVVFMGSPEFAIPSLDAVAASQHRVLAVVTQPDRPSGRGRKLRPCPVAARATDLGLSVLKPERFRAAEFVEQLENLGADVFVVVAYGEILRKRHLSLPARGCVNVHPSLLPRHRGAVPIQATLLAGDDVTGVTTILMDRGVDTGDILLQRAMEIAAGENAGSLHDRLARLGGDLLVETLTGLETGELTPTQQDDALATHCHRLSKEDGQLDWAQGAIDLYRRIRAMTPWPGATTTRDATPLTVLGAELLEVVSRNPIPGRVVGDDRDRGPVVACGTGSLLITELKPAGSRAMSGADFLHGHALKAGEVWGTE
jgi:methionyl-tRNA formyltransferase